MARLNSEQTLWTVLPLILVVILLIVGIIFLPKTGTDVRGRASEPKAIVTPLPSRTEAPEVICSDLYSPVCGSDRKTYPNTCEANLVGITSFVEGPCPTILPNTRTITPTSSPNLQFTLPASN